VSAEEASVRIEVALYASGRPLSLQELKEISGLRSEKKVLEIARALSSRFNSLMRGLEIVELPNGFFVLQVKTGYERVVKRVANKPLVTDAALEVLSYIAFNQPVPVRELAKRLGRRCYRHIKTLLAMDLVEIVSEGSQRFYVTTKFFSTYFGLSEDRDKLKRDLKNLVKKRFKDQRAPLEPDGESRREYREEEAKWGEEAPLQEEEGVRVQIPPG